MAYIADSFSFNINEKEMIIFRKSDQGFGIILIVLFQGVCRLESQGKSYQNHPKSGKSGKVREFEKNVVPSQGKSGKIVLPKYLIRVVN